MTEATQQNGNGAAAAAAAADGKPAERLIEAEKPLSQSLLWGLLRRYYQAQGIDAWKTGIMPHYITCNPFIAEAYAKVVLGWLRDCRAAGTIQREEPVYLLELGAGHGRFGFLFLRRLLRMLEQSALHDTRITYVMTNLVDRNVAFWREHPALGPMVASGHLDFARFDAERDEAVELVVSGKKLARGEVANPVAVVANYVFDSLAQDAFHVRDGQLLESRARLSSSHEDVDLEDIDVVKKLTLSFDAQETSSEGYYEDGTYNEILRSYQEKLDHTSVLFPRGALGCVRNLARLSPAGVFLLSADKGHSHEETLLAGADIPMELHGGGFSFSVNYHAIAEYVRRRGGRFFHTPHGHESLSINASVLGGGSQEYRELRQAYEDAIVTFGPDEFFTLSKVHEHAHDVMTMEQVLALLRLSRWDPAVFCRFARRIAAIVASAASDHQRELYWGLRETKANYYHLGDRPDVPFHVGLILCKMGHYAEGIREFEESLRLYGPDAGSYNNLGSALYALNRFDEALAAINRALELEPNSSQARSMRLRVEAERRRQGAPAEPGESVG